MYELSIAIRHLTTSKRQTALSVAAVSIGIMALVVINALTHGSHGQMINALLKLTPSVVITPSENEDKIFMYKSLISTIGGMEHVEYVAPYVTTQAIVKYQDITRSVQIKGIVPDDEMKILDLESYMINGTFAALDYRSIIIGDNLLDELNAQVGDQITLTNVKGEQTGLKIVGVFNMGFEEFDKGMTYVTLKRAQKMAGMTNSVSGISLSTDDIYIADSVAQQIRTETGTNAQSWLEVNKDFLQLLELDKQSSNVIIIFLLVAAAFGIANTMIMTVMGKVREIGMLKAMGAKPRSIMKIFLAEGLLLGITGAIVGSILGYIFVVLLTVYPIRLTGMEEMMGAGASVMLLKSMPMDYVYGFIVGISVSIIASFLPARRASKLEAVEALAHV